MNAFVSASECTIFLLWNNFRKYTRQFIILHWDCNMHHSWNICKGQDVFFKNFTFFRKKIFKILIIVAFLYMLYTVLTTFLNVGRAGKLFPWEQQKKPGQKRTRCTKSTAFFCYFCQHHYVRGTFIHSALQLFQFIAYLTLNIKLTKNLGICQQTDIYHSTYFNKKICFR